MALAGELLQDLAAFAGVSSLESVAKFPGDMAALAAAASAVDDARAARMQHDGGTAAGTTAIKDGEAALQGRKEGGGEESAM
jgi:Ciliary BBSome complex subunit 2, C-terminal